MRIRLSSLYSGATKLGIELVEWPTTEDVFQAEKRRREELEEPSEEETKEEK